MRKTTLEQVVSDGLQATEALERFCLTVESATAEGIHAEIDETFLDANLELLESLNEKVNAVLDMAAKQNTFIKKGK